MRCLGSTFESTLANAITDFMENTCIRLVPRTDEERYIQFYDGGVCKAPVGAATKVVKVGDDLGVRVGRDVNSRRLVLTPL